MARLQEVVKRLWNINSIESLNIINYDILQQDEVLVVGDAHSLPFKSNVFDSIICQAVLEHVKNPKKVVDEMLRVLKPGGHVFLKYLLCKGSMLTQMIIKGILLMD